MKKFKNKEIIILSKEKKDMKEKEYCFICKNHKFITEEHYIVPLLEVKESFKYKFENEVVYLCPNCHTYLHLLFKKRNVPYEDIYNYFYSNEMKQCLAKIIQRYYY